MSENRKRKNSSNQVTSNKRRNTNEKENEAPLDNSQACCSKSTPTSNPNSSQNLPSSIPNNQLGQFMNSQNIQRQHELTLINELVEKAQVSMFEKKIFTFGQSQKAYSPIYNFFTCQEVFESKPSRPINFECIFCKKSVNCRLGESGNLTKHLQSDAKLTEHGALNHEKFNNEWHPLYIRYNKDTNYEGIFIIFLEKNLLKLKLNISFRRN